MTRFARVRLLASLGLGLVVAASSMSAVNGQVLPAVVVHGVGWTVEEADDLFLQAIDSASIDLMERSIQTYRAVEGPYTLSQLPALQQLMQYRLRQQDWVQLREDLSTALGIYSAHYEPDHPIYIHISQVKANWHLLAYLTSSDSVGLAGLLPDLEAAYRLTSQAVSLASVHYGTAYPDLPEMLRDLAAMSWLFARHYQAGDTKPGRVQARHSGSHRLRTADPLADRHGYRQGQQALESVISLYQDERRSDPLALATAYLELSEWHRGFGYHQRAEKAYTQAKKTAALLKPDQRDQLFSDDGDSDPLRWLNDGLPRNLLFQSAQF
jgi:hypothetical protein